ncbi:MAG: LysM peptidoglycan-binding domain-containing protein [Actinomycetota bacterium]
MDAKHIRVLVAVLTLAGVVGVASADYQVEPGDTLAEIAIALGVSTADLARANNLSNPDLIRPGQMLVIPGEVAAGIHVVSGGETLAHIAARYGVAVADLVSVNLLANPNLIMIGQQISIPVHHAGLPGAADVAPTHTVAAGETLAYIAARHQISVADLAAVNGITDTSVIYAGTVLRLTGPTASPQPVESATSIHVVAAGENLARVAATYDTTVDALVTTNSLADPNLIRIGQELQIPGSSPPWVCPVLGARYFNDWGFPRSGGRFHEGTDLFAPRDTPVLAPVAGTLVIREGSVGGLQFWLYGDDGTRYIGSHLESAIGPGYVTAGTQVGTVGTSGNAVGANPHLHFEMHPGDGLAVNPHPVLRQHGC